MSSCFHCSQKLSFSGRVGLREECPNCRSDVHVCKNCEHFDPKMYNECREPQAERVTEKDRANRCDYFVLALTDRAGKDQEKERLRNLAEALFQRKDSNGGSEGH